MSAVAYVVDISRDFDIPPTVLRIGSAEREVRLPVRGRDVADAARTVLEAHTGRGWSAADVTRFAARVFGRFIRERRGVQLTIKGTVVDRFVDEVQRAAG
jgi:hypothetical protein